MHRWIGLVMWALVSLPVQAAELLMFEERGCSWCALWDSEIGPIYPETDEARCAPLRRIDLGTTRPATVGVSRPVTYTPTFVLLDRGREVGRIHGYPGDMHFWGLLATLMERLPETSCSVEGRG